MHVIPFPYESPTSLFRIYQDYERDKEGYPYIWVMISEQRRTEANHECLDRGLAYSARGDSLTVHTTNNFAGPKQTA